MKVAVLGSSGAMGSYFVEYFRSLGRQVVGSDVRGGRTGTHFRFVSSNPEAVKGADIVLLSVPGVETLEVAREIRPSLKRGCILVEIASVKGKLPAELRKLASAQRVSLLSVHPMFGPNSKSKTPKVVVIGGRKDLSAAAHVFPGARLVLVRPDEHDRLVAYTLSLVHLANMAFVSAVEKGVGMAKFRRVAPPFASTQLALAEAVLLQDPKLYSHIDIRNKFAIEAVSSFITQLSALRGMIEGKDSEAFQEEFSRLAGRFRRPDMEASLARTYSLEDS